MASHPSAFHSGNVNQAVGQFENPIFTTLSTGNVELTGLVANSHYLTYFNGIATTYISRITLKTTGEVEFWSDPGTGEVKVLSYTATQVSAWLPQEHMSYLQVHGITYGIGGMQTNSLVEYTLNAGVTAEALLLKDGAIGFTAQATDPIGGGTLNLWTFTGNVLRAGADNVVLGANASTDHAVARYSGITSKIQNSGVIVDDTNNVSGVGTLGVSGTITSTYTTSPAKILDFNAGAVGGNYSYLGNTANCGFGIEDFGGGLFGPYLSSDSFAKIRVGVGQTFRVLTGAVPSGDSTKFTVGGNGRITAGADATYYTSLKDEDNMVSNDDHSICTQQSIKAYVDSFYSSGTFSVTWTGIWAADRAVTAQYRRAGGIVTCFFPSTFAGLTLANVITSTVDVLTAVGLKPATSQHVVALVINGSATVFGSLAVYNTGFLRLSVDAGSFFTASDAGAQDSTCTWNLS